ncbi:MAG: EAL domain-containing protein [Terracidiphilus sp.]
MMFLTRLSVSSRFMIVLAIGFTFQAGISVVSLVNLKQAMLRDRTFEVKHLLETAYSTVAFYHDQASKGLMTDEAARKAAKDAVRAMHYDNNNYFFIWDLDGVSIAHGSHPEWEGRNLLKSPDKDKLPVVSYMVSQLVAVCRSDKKEGVTTYRISKFGQTKAIDKIAYTRLFEPWGWSIGTGAYVNDIDEMFLDRVLSLLWVFVGLISVASLFTYLIGRDLSGALTRLATRVASVAKGELDGGVPETARQDEVGAMARALLVLRDNSREAVQLRLDQLTGLPNRKMLFDRLNLAMAASSRSGSYCGLLLLDMDKFKTLNDAQGHDVGDLLLKEVARRLLACVRQTDTVARLSGDEFVVFVADIGQKEEEAATVAEGLGKKILAAINQPFYLANLSHLSSASAGLTLFNGNSASAEEVLRQADLAMYKSKEGGRNACRFFDPGMETIARERAALETDLRRAIIEKQFELYYQPQVGSDGALRGAEALIRWKHPHRGMVPPDTFIPLAEETGLIVPLGQWVLESACNQMAIWATRPHTASLKIAVNVSAREFQQPGFVEHILATLASTGADPNRLELELTESVLVENVDTIIEKMMALRVLGVSFSLDDFGTGYSSLSYLKRMPLDNVKIDRSFVRDLLVDPNDAAIALTVVALADALGFGVIAEGVETVEQLDFLAGCGCYTYQGYFFSRPLPLESFEKFVRQSGNAQPIHEAVA